MADIALDVSQINILGRLDGLGNLAWLDHQKESNHESSMPQDNHNVDSLPRMGEVSARE